MTAIVMRDEVYATIGAAIEVHKVLGAGFLEAVYQEAMTIELAARDIPYNAEVELPVHYKGQRLARGYRADFVCYDAIVVEIKALNMLTGTEEAQLHNYLKATGYKVGVLINFGSVGRLEWKRWVV